MRVKLWGTRGSLPTPRPATARYGGNTSCVEVAASSRSMVILDGGTGIWSLGATLPTRVERVDLLLSHLHMDHILGLGFFAGFFRPDLEVHLWGPGSTTQSLRQRLTRYLSPPLFPVRLRDLPCRLVLHEVPFGRSFDLPGLTASAALVCHPGPTVGYRLDDGTATMAYLPDHEPALGSRTFPDAPPWTSGHDLMRDVDLLLHDAQYTDGEYPSHVGWGHSSLGQAIAVARAAGVRHLVAFHHDPGHDDDMLDALYRALAVYDGLRITPAREGASFDLGRAAVP